MVGSTMTNKEETSYQEGILRQVVRRPSPLHFATSTSSSRFLSAAMEDRSS